MKKLFDEKYEALQKHRQIYDSLITERLQLSEQNAVQLLKENA